MIETIEAKKLLKKLRKIYENLDKELQKMFGNLIVCKKGCSLCCQNSEAYSTVIETINVITFLNSKLTSQEKEKIGKKIEHFDRIYNLTPGKKGSFILKSEHDFSKIPITAVPCPFLDELNNNCIIYRVRPLLCRIYISSSIEECIKRTEPSIMNLPKFKNLILKYKKEINDLNFQLLYRITKTRIDGPVLGYLLRQISLFKNEFVLIFLGGRMFRIKT